ncbi:DNA binding protein-like [Striga asiatica]|uniref:DNA binding protein-like n=1 Tax=Striga asiatica TaxID=4170 RepID=A0A5A7QLD8_STRAF|nr:DNA binding protein-like [Striga asiatica]
MAFTLLKNVNMDKTEWNIKVCVVRCYERTTFGDRSTFLGLEVILHDSEGYRIHASIKKFHMELFRRHVVLVCLNLIKNWFFVHFSFPLVGLHVKWAACLLLGFARAWTRLPSRLLDRAEFGRCTSCWNLHARVWAHHQLGHGYKQDTWARTGVGKIPGKIPAARRTSPELRLVTG